MSVLFLKDLVLALLGDSLAEFYGAVRENIRNNQDHRIIGLAGRGGFSTSVAVPNALRGVAPG